MVVKTRYCNDCTQFDCFGLANAVCLLGHKPRSCAPRGESDLANRTWGFKRRCEDFCPVATAPEVK
jgi:hypothetical protein